MAHEDETPTQRLQVMSRPIAEIIAKMLESFAGNPVPFLLVMLNNDPQVKKGDAAPCIYVANVEREQAIDALSELLEALRAEKGSYPQISKGH